VLYEALAGQTPHAECETLGGLMVALDPAQRYPTAEALLEALDAQLPFGTKLEPALLRV
jgi:hypothetical protein